MLGDEKSCMLDVQVVDAREVGQYWLHLARAGISKLLLVAVRPTRGLPTRAAVQN